MAKKEGIQVPRALGRWLDSQILILRKCTSQADEGHGARDVCGGAVDIYPLEGGRGRGMRG